MTVAVIVAAGAGSRFGGRKQFADLCGRPLLRWSIDLFESCAGVSGIVIVTPPGQVAEVKRMTVTDGKVIAVVAGGSTRTGSVRNGIAALPADTGNVLVHDAARPLASDDLVARTISALSRFEGVVPAVPVTDTVKIVEGELVSRTIEREKLRAVQTPQGFRASVIRKTHSVNDSAGDAATDDAAVLEAAGYEVGVIEGEPDNIKVTYPGDLEIAELIIKRKGAEICA